MRLKRPHIGTVTPLILAALGVLSSACTSNLSRFNVLSFAPKNGPASLVVTRYEIADQGSGAALLQGGGHILNRITIGGSYGRKINVTHAGGHTLNAGLHGNPRATY